MGEPSPHSAPAPAYRATAYFDVDGTLVGTNLLHPMLHLLTQQPTPLQSAKRIGKALLAAPALAAAELRDRRRFNELLFSHYQGMSEDRLVVLAQQTHERVIVPRIFKGARDLVAQCRRAGLRVVFVTGSLDITVGPLAKELGADAVIANRLEMRKGKATGKLLRPVVAGPGKARLIADDARAVGHDLGSCHAYSDSASDVPMLSVVGHPFCINPDWRLRDLARAYDWAVLDLNRTSPGESRQ
ncbi:MAG: HAD-IB family hydrolase [Deltaproteobacteria bacterium]|nr:HAD-IB family hydrolase [Deltaproteobacteria bacterium]